MPRRKASDCCSSSPSPAPSNHLADTHTQRTRTHTTPSPWLSFFPISLRSPPHPSPHRQGRRHSSRPLLSLLCRTPVDPAIRPPSLRSCPSGRLGAPPRPPPGSAPPRPPEPRACLHGRHHQAVCCISLPVRVARLDCQELQGLGGNGVVLSLARPGRPGGGGWRWARRRDGLAVLVHRLRSRRCAAGGCCGLLQWIGRLSSKGIAGRDQDSRDRSGRQAGLVQGEGLPSEQGAFSGA